MESPHEPCLHCHEAVALEAKVCPHCRREVLVDVGLSQPIGEGRLRYKLARSLSALGPPLPSFVPLQQALAASRPTIARRVTRAAAQRISAVLAADQLTAWVELARGPQLAVQPRTQERAGFSLAALAWALVFVVAVGGGGWVVWRMLKEASDASPAAKKPAAESSAPIAEASRPPALTTRQLAELGLPSTVSLRCENSVASGFFVAPDLVLTNAHALCSQGSMRVVLSDGRQAAGTTVRVDQALDLATVRVYDIKGQAVPMGDAGALAVGDKVVMIGSPMGLEFTVHEGTVSSLSRSIDGVAFIQLDAKINPGNSGGPLLDDQGRVVGVVSLKVSLGDVTSEGIGLALPINYAYRSVAAASVPAVGSVSSKGFEAMVARAKADQIDEKQTTAGGPLPDRGLPMLVALGTDRRTEELLVMVALPARARPEYRKLSFDVMVESEVLCTVESEVYDWTLLEGNVALGRIHPRYLPSIRRRASLGTLYLGEARLSLNRCPKERLHWGKMIKMADADPEFAAVK
jgi:serine protease Do